MLCRSAVMEEAAQVDADADLDKNRPALVDADDEAAARFLLSRKATAAALVSDRRDVEATDDDVPTTDLSVDALKAVAQLRVATVAVNAKKAILASLWNNMINVFVLLENEIFREVILCFTSHK